VTRVTNETYEAYRRRTDAEGYDQLAERYQQSADRCTDAEALYKSLSHQALRWRERAKQARQGF